jgi:hypothetical protein
MHQWKSSLFLFILMMMASCLKDETSFGTVKGTLVFDTTLCLASEIESACLSENQTEPELQAIDLCLFIHNIDLDQKYMLLGDWDFENGLKIDGLNEITFDAGEKFESRLYFLKKTNKVPSCHIDEISVENTQILENQSCQANNLSWCLFSLNQAQLVFTENLKSIDFSNPLGTCSIDSVHASCKQSNCENDFLDVDEMDIDCAGICRPCSASRKCIEAKDCESLICEYTTQFMENRCILATCEDGIKNQNETDIDCGGVCSRCMGSGTICLNDDDCTSRCREGFCCIDNDQDRICDQEDLCPTIQSAKVDENGNLIEEQWTQKESFERLGYESKGEADKGADCNDFDGDGIFDVADNCPENINPTQDDTFGGSLRGDACDDQDGDLLIDASDNCPLVSNVDQVDLDQDGKGNLCDMDMDEDSIFNENDNCPFVANLDQNDVDQDQMGDLCDEDDDNDGALDLSDNCPFDVNPSQDDLDQDTKGDLCDIDMDDDFVPNENDNCSSLSNANQNDLDQDRIGDLCDEDDDNDGALDLSDNCPIDVNALQENIDGDALGDLCDADKDGDGLANPQDNCPLISNPDQLNSEFLEGGDLCDEDDDNDGVLDSSDNCPFTSNTDQSNTDGASDGGNACDGDDDNDGVADVNELPAYSVCVDSNECASNFCLCIDVAPPGGCFCSDII